MSGNSLQRFVPLFGGRRRFLSGMVFTAIGASMGPLPAADLAKAASAKKTRGKCPGVKIPMKDVGGKVAFVTGGSSGIGLGIARAFVDAGMKVVIAWRTKEHLEEAMQYFEKAENRVHAIRVDVSDRPGMENAATETVRVFGKVHVLVNNAGVISPKTLSQTSYEDWDRLMRVNLDGVFNGVHAFLPHIKQHGEGGQVITTSSVGGLFVVGGGYGAYCTSKFAVVGMMEALRAELADAHIGVSVLCPGVVKSNLEERLKDLPVASDPFPVGQLVLRGLRNNDLYILTHPEFEPLIQHRNEALIASIPKDLRPTDARIALAHSLLQSSIYVTERDHQLCIAAGRG